jgi:signal peptidase
MKIVKNVFFAILVIILVAISGTILLTGKHDFKGCRILIVKSGSMEPTIKTGSLILIQKQSSYHVKDIVTYGSAVRKDTLITHRIVSQDLKSSKLLFTLKGDANKAPDLNGVPPSAILGKMLFAVPYLGYLIAFVKTPLGVSIFIIIPTTILVWEEVKNIREKLFTKKQTIAQKPPKKTKKKEKKK